VAAILYCKGGGTMSFDWRYNLKHIGDNFVDLVHHTVDAATGCSKTIFLTYDIKMYQRKKDLASGSIGARVTALIKEGVTDFSKDAMLAEHIATLNNIEKDLDGYMSEKNHLGNPFKVKKTPCECTKNCEKKE
jgi:hypothetical protein